LNGISGELRRDPSVIIFGSERLVVPATWVVVAEQWAMQFFRQSWRCLQRVATVSIVAVAVAVAALCTCFTLGETTSRF
jgi:hypothetical protein